MTLVKELKFCWRLHQHLENITASTQLIPLEGNYYVLESRYILTRFSIVRILPKKYYLYLNDYQMIIYPFLFLNSLKLHCKQREPDYKVHQLNLERT